MTAFNGQPLKPIQHLPALWWAPKFSDDETVQHLNRTASVDLGSGLSVIYSAKSVVAVSDSKRGVYIARKPHPVTGEPSWRVDVAQPTSRDGKSIANWHDASLSTAVNIAMSKARLKPGPLHDAVWQLVTEIKALIAQSEPKETP